MVLVGSTFYPSQILWQRCIDSWLWKALHSSPLLFCFLQQSQFSFSEGQPFTHNSALFVLCLSCQMLLTNSLFFILEHRHGVSIFPSKCIANVVLPCPPKNTTYLWNSHMECSQLASCSLPPLCKRFLLLLLLFPSLQDIKTSCAYLLLAFSLRC